MQQDINAQMRAMVGAHGARHARLAVIKLYVKLELGRYGYFVVDEIDEPTLTVSSNGKLEWWGQIGDRIGRLVVLVSVPIPGHDLLAADAHGLARGLADELVYQYRLRFQ